VYSSCSASLMTSSNSAYSQVFSILMPRLGTKPRRLKLALEYELQAMVFSHIKSSLRQILSERQLRSELKLTSKDVKTMSSREMANLLEQAVDRKDTRLLSVKVFIENLLLSSDDKSFLSDGKQLPKYLKRLAEVRRKPEHRIITKQLMNGIREIRSIPSPRWLLTNDSLGLIGVNMGRIE